MRFPANPGRLLGFSVTIREICAAGRRAGMVMLAAVSLLGCIDSEESPNAGRARIAGTAADQTFLVPAEPPLIRAVDAAGLADARAAAGRAGYAHLAERRGGARIRASGIPFLIGAPQGRAFLAAPLPRALARGEPAASCPAATVAAGAPSAADAAVAALGTCLAQLADTAPGAGCGCRVMALDRVLTVPRTETAYATGISARLVSPDLGLDLLLVAEETGDGTILRDLTGTVAELTDGEPSELRFADGTGTFSGHEIPVGFRRGRLAARYYLADADGRHLTLLIGFDPDELAAGAGAWLAWGG